MKYVDNTNHAEFADRYAACPLCRRDNVLLHYYAGQVVLAEHPLPMPILAHPAPIDPGARYNPRAAEAKIARVRCPASGEPLVLMDES
jgi:hypothetical protein